MRVRFGQKPRVAKALRLLEANAVEPIPDALVYRVYSESGNLYDVIIAAGIRSCTCPYGQNALAEDDCSHILAAQLHSQRKADPFEGIPQEKDLP